MSRLPTPGRENSPEARATLGPMDLNPFSSPLRPALAGRRGAVAAAHPLAVAAGAEALASGGSAVDAAIAAQAALAVVSPDACGLGGDAFLLVREPSGAVLAVNGAGPSAARASRATTTGGLSVCVPGIVDAWTLAHARWGRLPLLQALAPAIAIAEDGLRADPALLAARDAQADRLRDGGAGDWSLLSLAPGAPFRQPALAAALRAVATGRAAFHEALAPAIARAVQRAGGALDEGDLLPPAATFEAPLAVPLGAATVHVQPPASQGVLLALALDALARGGHEPSDHMGVELTGAAFTLREDAAHGAALLGRLPPVDPARASRRAGPRAYLHTAGVAVADADGLVVSSLVSLFDDFGSGVFVPEGGFTLNNRAGGFTEGANAFAPGKRPVHTLAPAMVTRAGDATALSTPGADGQVQTLLQVLLAWGLRGDDLASAVSAPRWRSEGGRLLVEAGHPGRADLAARGHEVIELPAGDVRFGAVTAAGVSSGAPWALPDWRRQTWAGVA